MWLEFWMSVVGSLMYVSLIPQIIRLYRRKKSKDLSIWMYVGLIVGKINWITYGFILPSFSIIISNMFCTLLDIIALTLIIKYRRN